MDSFYITTAIDYANGKPHIGHAYEKVLTDVIARYKRLMGNDVHFLTGMDEYGQKVQQSAEREGIEPQEFCNQMAGLFKAMCEKLEISNDDYIRTTEDRHKTVVESILQKLYDEGEIYKADYKGFYSTKEEQFLQEKDKVNDKWPAHFGEVVEISETNYFFKLSKHREWLIQYIKDNPDFIYPSFRAKEILEFLKEEINDMCISRPKERLAWGIPLPFDQGYVTYVWFDALINYISAVGYGTDDFEKRWPVDFHVIGKDILVPAHGVYWPIMLKAMGVPLPKRILVHGWWTLSGHKMSKSKGNVVDPLELSDKFGPDAFRFFLLREMSVGRDSDFSLDLFLAHYNSDLGNDLGNLLSRLLNMGQRYCDGKLPKASIEEEPEAGMKLLWRRQFDEVQELTENLKFNQALESIFVFIRGINRYAEIRAPWKLAKSDKPEDRMKLETAMAYMGEGLRLAALLLAPTMPGTCNKIHKLLGLGEITTYKDQMNWSNALDGKTLGEKEILFPRIELEAAET